MAKIPRKKLEKFIDRGSSDSITDTGLESITDTGLESLLAKLRKKHDLRPGQILVKLMYGSMYFYSVTEESDEAYNARLETERKKLQKQYHSAELRLKELTGALEEVTNK